MKVLLYADQCTPDFFSEPLVGYNMCKAIADEVDEAIVVTQVRNRKAIEEKGLGKAKVIYLDTERVAKPFYKLSEFLKANASLATLLRLPEHYYFEYLIWKKFKSEITRGEIDLIHRITPISSAVPSYLSSKVSIPFILGPVNGGLPYPSQFTTELHKEKEWLRYVRNLNKYVPYMGSTYAKASAVLAAFKHTIKTLPKNSLPNVINFPENGVSTGQFTYKQRINKDQLTFLTVGRLVPFKCIDVVISAFAQSDILRMHNLIIVGHGPELENLKSLVRQSNLEKTVTFMGQIEQKKVAKLMVESDVFPFPSIRDSGAGVVVESMYAGLVNVVVDYGPTAELVDFDRGIKIPLGDRQSHIEGFRKAMETLVDDQELRQRLSLSAHKHAEKYYTWERRAKVIRRIYDWVLDDNVSKPDYRMEIE